MRINILFILVVLIFCFSETVFAQRCPSSVRTFRIYVQNEHQAKKVRYEIIPLKYIVSAKDGYSLEFLSQNLGIERSYSVNLLQADHSVPANGSYVEKFLAHYILEKQPKGELGNNFSGRVMNGELILNASDLYYDFYLLKITSSNYQPAFLFGHLLGGCHERDEVLLQWEMPSKSTR